MNTLTKETKREPVYLTELNLIATVIGKYQEPNGNIIVDTSEGIRDLDACIPIETKLEFEAMVAARIHVAPSDKEMIENYFNF